MMMYTHACMYGQMCMCSVTLHIYISTYIYTHISVYLYTSTYRYVYKYRYTYTYTYTYIPTYYLHIYIRVYIYIYIFTYACIYMSVPTRLPGPSAAARRWPSRRPRWPGGSSESWQSSTWRLLNTRACYLKGAPLKGM